MGELIQSTYQELPYELSKIDLLVVTNTQIQMELENCKLGVNRLFASKSWRYTKFSRLALTKL
jgi:hypothetical protein